MSYTKGSIIFFSGDKDERIFILQKGFIVLTSTEAETGQTVTEYVKEGEFFGVKSALGRFPRDETATVAVDSSVISMSVPEFEQLFSSNKQVIMKMLKVFSKQLRSVHKKIESILGNGATVNLETGMISVAQSFYSEDEYRSCCDVCLKFLKLYPNSPAKDIMIKMYTDAKIRMEKLQQRAARNEQQNSIDAVPITPSVFSLPGFARFAKTFEPGAVIIAEFEPGESFYLIQSGVVQLVKCVNGVKKNLDMLHPGEFFGEMAILDNTPRSATCLAYTKVTVLEFNKENFVQLITGNPQIALILLKLFCKRIYDQRRRFRILVMPEPQIRIADVFLMYDEMNPVSNPAERKRTFYITVQDIANWTAMPVEQVQDELNRMAEKRRIEMFTDHMVVFNIVDMERLVEGVMQMHQ